jgi:phenylacetate-CoA ligase
MIYERPLIERVYRRSPVPLQHMWVSVYGALRRAEQWLPAYRRYRTELARSRWLSREEIQALQTERSRALIQHCYENVPYYRRVFDERKLKPANIRTADDLYKLPVLTKQDVRRHSADLRARNIPASRTFGGKTGGTTGEPLRFSLDHDRVLLDHALVERFWGWAGYRPGDRLVMVRQTPLYSSETLATDFWRHDWTGNRIYLSSLHISRATLPRYLSKLQEWRPRYLAGHPSSLFIFGRFMESQGIQIPVRAVFTSSEALTPLERQVIERQFACRVWDRYGANERLVSSQQCEHGNYHQNAEFGLLQVDWPAGTPAAPGAKGELVQTGLTNLSMPLIRYASGDVGCLCEDRCACGRGLPLMGPVDGRKDSLLVTADGRWVPSVGLERVYQAVEHVERCQLVQKRVGEVIVRVQPQPGFDAADATELVRRLRRLLGAGTEIRVEQVAELRGTANGKRRYVVSEVDIDQVSGLALQVT